MPKPEIEKFILYAENLAEATRRGAMHWTRVNPTTFTWTVQIPTPASLTLQSIDTINRRRVNGALVVTKTTNYVFKHLI